MRGKRGLNHVHVGRCTRPTTRWRCATPATSTPGGTRASASGWCAADDDHRVQPGREGPVLRAGRRQGLPAPDVLRHPRRRPAPVRAPATEDESARTSLSEDAEDHRWAFGTGFDDPLAGDRHRRSPTASTPADLAAYCLMLGDDALISAHRLSAVVHAQPGARGGHRAGQHRAGPARPGAAAAGPGRAGRGPRAPGRGRAGVLPRRARVPQRPARRASTDGDFAQHGRPAAGLRGLAAGAVRPAGRLGRDPVLAAIAAQGRQRAGLPPRLRGAVGAQARRRHGAVARPDAAALGRPLAADATSSSGRPEVAARLQPGSAATRRTCGPRSTRCSTPVLGAGHAGPPAGRPARPGGGRRGGTACTPRRSATLLAEMQSVARAHPEATW